MLKYNYKMAEGFVDHMNVSLIRIHQKTNKIHEQKKFRSSLNRDKNILCTT